MKEEKRKVGKRRFLTKDQLIPLCILIVICVVSGIANPVFFTWATWQNILMQVSNVGIIALGAMFVVASGGLDFTAGDGVSLAGVAAAFTFLATGYNVVLTVLAGILTGAAMGAANGLIITKLRINPFVTTLAMMTLIKGVMLVVAEGHIIHLDIPESNFVQIGRGIIPVFGQGKGIPVAFCIFMAMAVIAWVLLRHTRFGSAVLALGGNEEAARLNGVKVKWYRFLVFMVAGTFTGIGAIITLARVGGIGITLGGTVLLMDVMAAVVIGGTSVSGGKCNIFGVVMGTFVIITISTMLTYIHIDTNWRDVVKGAIILAALIIDVVGKKFEEAREAKTMAALKAEHHKELLAQLEAQEATQA